MTNKIIKKFVIMVFVCALCVHSFAVSFSDDKQKCNIFGVLNVQQQLSVDLDNTNIGSTIFFGRYEQDDNYENGMEPIEWIVLRRSDGVATLISNLLIDCLPFNLSDVPVSWENSHLRLYLNNEIFTTAFTDEEKECILITENQNEPNPFYGTSSGNVTKDRLYIPSIKDMFDYFTDGSKSDEERYKELLCNNIHRMASGTVYAENRGLRVLGKDSSHPRYANYLLRTAGKNGTRIWYGIKEATNYQTYITEHGALSAKGTAVISHDDGVRLMMKVIY